MPRTIYGGPDMAQTHIRAARVQITDPRYRPSQQDDGNRSRESPRAQASSSLRLRLVHRSAEQKARRDDDDDDE
jgi:hypothetical protein